MNNDLKWIKKKYGEKVMHFCREKFSMILEYPGLLPQILAKTFAPNRFLGDDMVEISQKHSFFVKAIMSQFNQGEKKTYQSYENPFDLMHKAGYTLYECHSEGEIQAFRKFYAPNEELCTFKGGRLNRCFVFFAVRDDVAQIRREDYSMPEREDSYGTSVIGIQFDRITGCVSIKSRYNHSVTNPDATFRNDLDAIIPGLRCSFENYIRDKYNDEFVLTDDDEVTILYTRENGGKYYRFYHYVDGVYFCEDNIIIDHGKLITDYSGEKKPEYIFCIDNLDDTCLIFDVKAKRVFTYDGKENDLTNKINNKGPIRRISIHPVVNSFNKIIVVKYEDGSEYKIPIDSNWYYLDRNNKCEHVIANDGKYYEVDRINGNLQYSFGYNIIIDNGEVILDYAKRFRYRIIEFGDDLVIIDKKDNQIYGYNGVSNAMLEKINSKEIQKIIVQTELLGVGSYKIIIEYTDGQKISFTSVNGRVSEIPEIEGEKSR